MSNVLIITGGNKGIGKGITQAYLDKGYQIFSISRTLSEDFPTVNQILFDLSKTNEIKQLLTEIFQEIDEEKVEKITLINNAGTLGQIGRLENISDIEATVKLNTIAPLLLISVFIALTKTWNCAKHIINISSGAAYKPYYGWTVYCATKAAIDMMTKTIALEQEALTNGAHIIAIYPGVVDTEMQTQIRKSDKQDFAAIDRFLELKATNALASPITVGQQIFAIDHDQTITKGTLIRVDE